MGSIDEGLLDAKLGELEGLRAWSSRTLAKLEALLRSPDDLSLLRVNPITFARERGIPQNEALDLFLHAAYLGLFTMEWHLLCPLCGTAVESFASLRGVHRHFMCGLCQIATDANLDDYIQVSFTVAPSVRRLPYHDPQTLSADDYFYNLRMTREMHILSLSGPRMRDLMPQMMKVLTWVAPGERREFAFDAAAGTLAAAELQAHCGAVMQVADDAPAGTCDLVIAENALVPSRQTVRSGRIEGSIVNRRATPVVFALDHQDAATAGQQMPTTVLEPMVTGSALLTSQTFRRLFRNETVLGSEGIGVREVTVLFTDLKGSTALYERIGDFRAFSLVQQHFEHLGAVITTHGGAIVKTIGDAVMAAFQRPADAVRAAFEMLERIARSNREQGSDDIVLKIGIHRGPSIAVTLNDNLDYFGHTVNVAARVQGLAGAAEICVTDAIYQADEVAALLGAVEPHDAQLRGIHKKMRIYKVARQDAQPDG